MPPRPNTEVRSILRNRIFSGELPAGIELSQVALADDLGISRTPLREAQKALEAERLVSRLPNGRLRVAPISLDDLEQLYGMRVVLEAYGVAQTVLQFTADELVSLQTCLEQMDEFMRSGDVDAWEEPHREFHGLLVCHSGSRVAAQLQLLAESALRYRHMYVTSAPRNWAQTSVEHRAIFDACARRDAGQASRELATHLARTALTLIAQIAPQHEPARVRTALGLVASPPPQTSVQFPSEPFPVHHQLART